MKIRLIVEYKGTGFFGWQKQVGVITVQSVLEKALIIYLNSERKKQRCLTCTELDETFLKLVGSGRTDAGVHAVGQVATFIWPENLVFNKEKFLRGINGLVPDDIAIREVSFVAEDFHPRISAISKTYIYKLMIRQAPPVLDLGQVWHIRKLEDIQSMIDAATLFIGEHDFKSFKASDCNSKSSVRIIYKSLLTFDSKEIITYNVTGNGFLKNQVRFMVGALVAIGKKQLSISELESMINGASRLNFKIAPAMGLTLENVNYHD